MEGQPAEPLRPSENPGEVLNRIIANEILGDNMDTPALLRDVQLLVHLGAANGPKTSGYLKSVGNYRQVRAALLDEVNKADAIKDGPKVLENIKLAQVFGMNKLPKTWAYFSYLQNEYGDNVKPEKKPKPRGLKRKVVLAAGAGMIAAASIVGSGGLISKPGSESSGKQTTTQTTPETATAVPPTQTPTETAKVSLNEMLKPLIEEALKRRADRAKNDPEYYYRVDKELNQDRVNILLYGYGEEWTGGEIDQPTFGSHSIFSINLRTGKIDLVSPTHDTRAPEIEQFLKKNGKEARPTRMDRAYEIGGYDLMRQVLEDATGLSVDYQIKAEDTLIKYLIDNLGGINVDIPFDVNTKQFRDDGKMYPPHQFSKGSQKMDGITALQFIKAWSDPVDPTKERNIRKHLAMKAIFDQVKQKTKEGDRMFGFNMFSLLATENLKGNIGFDFDEKQFIFPMLGNLGKLGKLDLSIDKTIFVVDPAIGDGGVQWITANAAENPITQKDIENGVYGQDLAMEIPFNANPYSSNLVRDYWKSVRDLISSRLGKPQQPTVGKPEPTPPAATATPRPTETPTPSPTPTSTPTETPTPKPPPTPEKVAVKGNLFQEFAKVKYEVIEKNRLLRETEDPEYSRRVDKNLSQDRINILILGENQGLTDAIIVASYHIPSHSLYLTSFPRDLQARRALELSGNVWDSRINQIVKLGGKKGIEEMSKETERITGLAIDATTQVNFKSFIRLIDSIGGIEIDLKEPIHDTEYPAATWPHYETFHLPAGKQNINGETALKLARTRKSFQTGAHQRDDNQRYVLERIPEKVFSDPLQIIPRLNAIREVINQSIQDKSLTIDHPEVTDISSLVNNVKGLSDALGAIWNSFISREDLGQVFARPKVYSTSLRQFIVSAGIPGISIDTLRKKQVRSADYYSEVRSYLKGVYTQNTDQKLPEDVIEIELPAREQRILYPEELPYSEVIPRINKLKNSHDAVITESLFTWELAGFTKEKRQEVMQAIAKAHARALMEHYGDVDAIIGIDPGHGGSDIGSVGTAPGGGRLAEKELTWELSNMVAEEIYQQTGGRYTVVILRPEQPHDEDLDQDKNISAVERIQKRKALLLATEEKLRPNLEDRGRNIAFVSVHLNGSPNPGQKGTEVYWPNEVGIPDNEHRQASQSLAQKLQQKILAAIRGTGYSPVDRGAKEDPDRRPSQGNSETTVGQYVALGGKLDRNLTAR